MDRFFEAMPPDVQAHDMDRLYAEGLLSFYEEVESLSQSIWPGMQLCPVCIYRQNGPAFLYKHPNPPDSFRPIDDGLWCGKQSDLQLFGATQVPISGTLTAINYYGLKDRPVEHCLAELFHEMHHVYQRTCMQTPRWDDPSLIVTYPEQVENDALKIFENRLLLQLLFTDDEQAFQRSLNLFHSSRLKRRRIIGDAYLDWEKRAESVEGPATYCQYRYLEARRGTPWSRTSFRVARHHEFLSVLDQMEFGRENLRHRLLMTGLAQCLILARQGFSNWEQEYFASDLLLSDFLFSRLPVQEITVPDIEDLKTCASYFLSEMRQARQKRLSDFESQRGLRVSIKFRTLPEFRGFDPMNAEAIDDTTILHNTMLNLGKNDDFLSFLTGGVVAKIAGSVWATESLTFYLQDDEQLQVDQGRITLNAKGRQLSWHGDVVSKSKGSILIELE